MTRSTPRSSDSGNIMPASMTRMFSPRRRAIMFIPNSPRPPRGIAVRDCADLLKEASSPRRERESYHIVVALEAEAERAGRFSPNSKIEERFLRSGTAKAAVPPVEMTLCLGTVGGQSSTSTKLDFYTRKDEGKQLAVAGNCRIAECKLVVAAGKKMD